MSKTGTEAVLEEVVVWNDETGKDKKATKEEAEGMKLPSHAIPTLLTFYLSDGERWRTRENEKERERNGTT